MEFRAAGAESQYAALVRATEGLLVGVDFDGTLAPLVDDPNQAHIHPGAAEALVALSEQVRAIAVITGRPVAQVLGLGDLEQVGERIDRAGRELFVLGQYGNERWTSSQRRVSSPPPPEGLALLLSQLPALLRRSGHPEAWVEEKGLAIAVHTRRLDDPARAYEDLLPVLTDASRDLGLGVEPGRNVIEIRSGEMDKGRALRALVEELDAGAVVFCGDDLGDLEAFRAVDELRRAGRPGLCVCSAPDGDSPLVEEADVVVDGPGEVLGFFDMLGSDIRAARL